MLYKNTDKERFLCVRVYDRRIAEYDKLRIILQQLKPYFRWNFGKKKYEKDKFPCFYLRFLATSKNEGSPLGVVAVNGKKLK